MRTATISSNDLVGPLLHLVVHVLVLHPPGAALVVLGIARIVLLHHRLVPLIDRVYLAEQLHLEVLLDVLLTLLDLFLLLLLSARFLLLFDDLHLVVYVY